MDKKTLFKKPDNNLKEKILYGLKIAATAIGSITGMLTNIFYGFLSLLTACIILSGIVCCFIYIRVKPDLDECRQVAYDKLANMDESDFVHGMDTYVYDKDNNLIGLINAGNFDYVDISKISMNIQNAYISQEDKRFKEHTGVDWLSTIRAGLALIKNDGEITQGGSTITQQVVKNTYLTQEKSFTRKVIEILLAPELEKKFSKAKIMEFYCNTNYYANRCYGVQAASQYYFGKDASEVTMAEAATLVGISNSPSAYDPVKNYEACLEKRNSVLEKLYENGYLTENECNDAQNESLVVKQNAGAETFETYQSSYAIHCAALELMKQENFNFKYVFANKEDYDAYMEKYEKEYAIKTEEIRSGGYKIYTSLDSSIQEKLQNQIDSTLAKFTELQENGKYAMQGAAAVADNSTGYIVAVVGGRGTDDQFNRAYLSARQPGSAIKPLIDYAPAFDTGEYYPSKIMNDHEIENGPKNSGGKYRGNITIREAVNRSINTIAWQVLDQIGVNNGLDYLGEMQFQKISYVDNDVTALSIGGFTNGVRIVDMVKGYQTLANDGLYSDNTCIVELRDSNDNLKLKTKVKKKQVYDEDTAYMMTDVLKGTLTKPYGTGYGLALKNDIPAAGKTGTTNANKDTWFCGYTKKYTTAVWVGYDTPRAMPGIYGATYAGKIWKQFMNEIHEGLEINDWEAPSTVFTSYYDPNTGAKTDTDTGLIDLFSRAGETKAAIAEKEKEMNDIVASAYEAVDAYEKTTIKSAEDTYSIEEDFNTINNIISKVEDTTTRNALYNRVYEKYKQLKAIKEDMADEIALYEQRKKDEESEAALEEESKAEEERLEFIKSERIQKAEEEVSKLENLEYIPTTPISTEAANKALSDIEDYAAYSTYHTRLMNALEQIKNLPTYDEYKKKKDAEAAEEAAKRASEEAELHAKENEINKQIEKEINKQIYKGPGYDSMNAGPGGSN